MQDSIWRRGRRGLIQAGKTATPAVNTLHTPTENSSHMELLWQWQLVGLLTVFKPKPKPRFSARTEENRNRNF